MIRSILVSCAFLAVAGVAQAAETTVNIAGKSDAAIRAELSQATKLVCSDVSAVDYAPCLQETYQNALDQVAKVRAKAGK
jgi:hypothetical protein